MDSIIQKLYSGLADALYLPKILSYMLENTGMFKVEMRISHTFVLIFSGCFKVYSPSSSSYLFYVGILIKSL